MKKNEYDKKTFSKTVKENLIKLLIYIDANRSLISDTGGMDSVG